MPIIRNNLNTQAIYTDDKSIIKVYQGETLIWESARSCYGSGAWKNDRPWLNDDRWSN